MSSDVDNSDEISPDLVFELLSSARRRMVLYYLRQNSGKAMVNELAEQVAAMENEIPVEKLTRQQQKRVYVSLYQTHLPKLEDANIIEYDTDAGEVQLTSRADEFDRMLIKPEDAEYPWPLHYIALSVVSALVLILTVARVTVFAAVPPVWVGLTITGAFAVSAIAQYYRYQRRKEGAPKELVNG